MKALLKLPVEIHAGFLHACPLVSREYEILEILCESAEVKLLLDRAEEYYSDAVPYMKEL